MKTQITIALILTTAVAIGGEVLRAGTLIEVSEDEAKDLLGRGRAELYTPPANTDPAPGDPIIDPAAAIVAGDGQGVDALPSAVAATADTAVALAAALTSPQAQEGAQEAAQAAPVAAAATPAPAAAAATETPAKRAKAAGASKPA